MTDPIEGTLGSLVLSGWIGEAPDGTEYPYLLLTTPDERSRTTMPMVADVLDLAPGRVITNYGGPATVQVSPDPWASLIVGDRRFTRPVTEEWAQLARERGVVVLAIGMEPHPPEMDPAAYIERQPNPAVGLIPVR